MLGIYVKSPWPSFYKKGMKSWEIRSYSTNYRGDVVLIESETNVAICKMTLVDCIPLNKVRWEMNFEKHRTMCSYENLPYKKSNSPAYAWILENPYAIASPPIVKRNISQPIIDLPDSFLDSNSLSPIIFTPERIACKFIGDTMFLYWMMHNYFALISIVDLKTNHSQIITAEILDKDLNYILNQLSPT